MLNARDKQALDGLRGIIERTLVNEKWWLPVNDVAAAHFLDDTWTRFIGAFDCGALVAASGLFLNEIEFGDTMRMLPEYSGMKAAEVGRCMVSPEYRGHGLMLAMCKQLVPGARHLGIDALDAIAHQCNVASCASLERLGMRFRMRTTKHGSYVRNVYVMELPARSS